MSETNQIYTEMAHFPDEKKWKMISEGMEIMIDALRTRRPLATLFFDKTKAGGAHRIATFFSPESKSFYVQIPDEPNPDIDGQSVLRGGRFTTMLHALEAIAYATGQSSLNGYHPVIEIVRQASFPPESEEIVLPLHVNPDLANFIVIDKQLTSINGNRLLEAYYAWYKHFTLDSGMNNANWLRHTMLVHPKDSRPQFKQEIGFIMGVQSAIGVTYKLVNPGRIAPPIQETGFNSRPLWFTGR